MKMMSIKDVCAASTLSRVTVHRLEKSDPTFPQRRVLSGRRVGYLADEFDRWLSDRAVAPAPGTTGRQPGPGRPRKQAVTA